METQGTLDDLDPQAIKVDLSDKRIHPRYLELLKMSTKLKAQDSRPFSAEASEKNIRIFATTWNLKGQLPELKDLDILLKKQIVNHDLYVIGTQEAESSIARSMILASKDRFDKVLKEYFSGEFDHIFQPNSQDTKQEEFVLINSISLGATHLVVFLRKSLVPFLSDLKNDTLALGAGDFLVNKGAVSISFKLGKVRMNFINCHLAAHNERLFRRNE